jgi:hypothetical protein
MQIVATDLVRVQVPPMLDVMVAGGCSFLRPSPAASGGTQPCHRRQLRLGGVCALAVQPHEEVLARQLRRRKPCQQLPGFVTAIPLLDRADRRIERLNHAQPTAQLGNRRHPRIRGRRSVPRADAHQLPLPAAYPLYQIGASPAEMTLTSQSTSFQVTVVPIGIYAAMRPSYSRNRV